MKTCFRYIAFILTVFAIILCKGENVSSQDNIPELIEQLANETESLSVDIFSSSDKQLLNFANSQVINKNSVRRDNVQRNISFVAKTIKTPYEKLPFQIVNKLTLRYFISSEPTHRLISLGKLII